MDGNASPCAVAAQRFRMIFSSADDSPSAPFDLGENSLS